MHERAEVLHTHVLRSLETLHGIGALFTVRGEVSRAEFRAYVAGALARQTELQALAWDARVAAAERPACESRARAEGFRDFAFRDEEPGRHARPVAGRDEYFPVMYLEPLERNQDAFGFDVGSEPLRRASAGAGARRRRGCRRPRRCGWRRKRARSSAFSSSSRSTAAAPIDVAERRAALSGFAVAVFRIGDLVAASRARGAAEAVAALAHRSRFRRADLRRRAALVRAESLAAAEVLDIAGRPWRLRIRRRADRWA